MWPVLIESSGAGGLSLNTYGLFILLAFVCAFLLVHGNARRMGIHPERLVGVYVGAAIGGMFGARLLYLVAVEGPGALVSLPKLTACAGFAYYGGVLGGMAVVILIGRLQGLPGWKLVDLLSPALVLGLGVGRLGCFFAGCCHGAVAPRSADAISLFGEGALKGHVWLDSSFPWLTLEFHPGGVGSILYQPLYPTQLWSALAGLIIAGGLVWVFRHRRFDGQVFATMLLVEPIARVVIEAFRADHRGAVVVWEVSSSVARWIPGMAQVDGQLASLAQPAVEVGLTTSQTIGLSMIMVGAAIYWRRRGAGVAPEVALEEEY